MSRHNRERRKKDRVLPDGLSCLKCGCPFESGVTHGGRDVPETVVVCGSCATMHVLRGRSLREATPGEQFAAEMDHGEFLEQMHSVSQEAESDERHQLLSHNRKEIERYHHTAVADGSQRPVVYVLNLVHGLARKIGEKVRGADEVERYARSVPPDTIPTMLLAMEYAETEAPLRMLMSESMFATFQKLRSKKSAVIAVVISGSGTLLASWEPKS